MSESLKSGRVQVALGTAAFDIEYRWVGRPCQRGRPLMVFLHEGLGSVAMWRSFPHMLCEVCDFSGFVYSRPGYGASTPRRTEETWGPDFMHVQACQVLPAVLHACGIDPLVTPTWLYGHSDGGSIALIAAARQSWPIQGMAVAAPHIVVEDVSIQSIAAARIAYRDSDLRARLAKFHQDADSAFFGWNDVWLSPAFRSWTLFSELDALAAPVLAIQGTEDVYGTMEQIRGIKRRAVHADVQLLELSDCGHSPHRDQPDQVIAAVGSFVRKHHFKAH